MQHGIQPWQVQQAEDSLVFLYDTYLKSGLRLKSLRPLGPKSAPSSSHSHRRRLFRDRMLPKSELDARYKKLFDRLKSTMRVRHYSIRTERAYEQWIRRFLSFHKTKAVAKIGAKDIDFETSRLTVRDGKGNKDRVTMLPQRFAPLLEEHLNKVRAIYEDDLKKGVAGVYIWPALGRKYPNAAREWIWQYVFPSNRLSVDPRSRAVRRHHVHSSSLQKAVKTAAFLYCHLRTYFTSTDSPCLGTTTE